MTEILDTTLPADERGNDPNDFRADQDYMEMLYRSESEAKQIEARQAEETGFQLIRLDELVENVTGTQYLIKPYLEKDCVGTLFGDSDTYKTFIALDIGLSLAAGIDYHRHKLHSCPVVYIAGEGHGGIGRRVLAWMISHNIKPGEIPFFASTVPAQLIEQGNAVEIVRVVKSACTEDPGLIIIDTLSTNIGDGDESDNKDMARLLNNVNLYLRSTTHACVLIVAHVGHGDKERERGAYCIRGNVDFRVLIKREGTPQERRCTMFSLKTKDGPLFPPTSFKAEIVTLPGVLDSEGEESTSLVLDSIEYVPQKDRKSLPEKSEQCLIVLQDLYQTAATNLTESGRDPKTARVQNKDWQAECIRRKAIKGKSPASEKAQFQRIKRELRDGTLIQVDGVYVTPILPAGEG